MVSLARESLLWSRGLRISVAASSCDLQYFCRWSFASPASRLRLLAASLLSVLAVPTSRIVSRAQAGVRDVADDRRAGCSAIIPVKASRRREGFSSGEASGQLSRALVTARNRVILWGGERSPFARVRVGRAECCRASGERRADRQKLSRPVFWLSVRGSWCNSVLYRWPNRVICCLSFVPDVGFRIVLHLAASRGRGRPVRLVDAAQT